MTSGAAFEWDPAKAASNLASHGVSFETVAEFDFRTALIEPDTRRHYGEARMTAIGWVALRVHVLVYTERDAHIRVYRSAGRTTERSSAMPAATSRNAQVADAGARALASLETMTPEEDAAITAAARRDHDNPPMFWDESPDVGPGEWTWLDIDLIERLKADGPDWELRANQILRKALGL